ncbi:AAA family ATPase [Azospirillum sp. A1-3]|uniref:TrlF family AAA-like ATPase n=1 Tax=Azospirillum sp. A1-3 TaxID=185874 RepID=UPI0020772591|nr:AAA family ATPase [Azospirillum sp. A1-3]MCM8739361.1 AAA family ATPase [Azospirillum sp. A1-3]
MLTPGFAGASWWAFDFHTHTPASSDYGKGPNQNTLKQITPEEWLLAFMRNRIDCVAVSDHNSGEWIDRLKAALTTMAASATPPNGYRPLTLFPGVEITANGGTHVLAIFDPSATSLDIVRLLTKVDYNGSYGDSEVAANKSVIDIVREIRAAGALPILAHADRDRGAFRLTGNTLKPLLECGLLAAIEMTHHAADKPQIYQDLNLRLPEVLGSDSHHPDGANGPQYPGSHFTWVKMESPCMEGLCLALLDGAPLSVRRSDMDPSEQNRLPALMIESIEVANAFRCGRPQPLRVQFSPWLSTIVGGRGSGKSTVLEMMRIGLHREDEVPSSLADDFMNFKRVGSRSDRGMLTSSTSIKVKYRKDGAEFYIQWSQADDLPIITQVQPDGLEAVVPGDVRSRFPARLFSQKQVFTMAESQDALLRAIDEAESVNKAEWQTRWDQEEKRYLSLMAKCRELDAQASQLGKVRGELDDVIRKLSVFEGAHHADTLKSYQTKQRQVRVLDEWRKRWANAEEQVLAAHKAILPPDVERAAFSDPSSEAEAGALELLDGVHAEVQELAKTLKALAEATAGRRADWETRRDGSAWHAGVAKCEEEYNALVARLRDEGVENSEQHGVLVQQRQKLEQRILELEKIEESRLDIVKKAHGSLDRLKALRQEITQKRQGFINGVLENNQYVKIKILPYQPELSIAERAFRSLINRANDDNFAQDILVEDDGKPQDGLLGRLLKDIPVDAQSAAASIEARLDEMKTNLIAAVRGEAIPVGMKKPLMNHLRKLTPEQCDRIRTWYPEDGLQVSYSADGTGRNFHPIEQASPGQKTAAILAFILAYGTEPLVLDQPEDDLDNRLIYDLIVQQLRQIKTRRQVIVVTHNPNIVVNGDAEKVLEMAFKNGQCVVAERGSLQSQAIRDAICRVMEGGTEAFEKRYKRIALGRFGN